MEFTEEQIHEKTQELVSRMATGKSIHIGEFEYSPRQYFDKLIQDGVYPGDLAVLTFSKAESSIDRVEAWCSVAVFVDRWAAECLEFEAAEQQR